MTDTHDERPKSLHEEWLETPPDERGRHPIDAVREDQSISPGDECPLDDCNGRWESHTVRVHETTTGNDDRRSETVRSDHGRYTVEVDPTPEEHTAEIIELISCQDISCPLTLKDPDKALEYLYGREGAEDAPTESS